MKILKNRSPKRAEKGEPLHEPGDARTLMWGAERDEPHKGRRMVRHRIERPHYEPSE
jgi:hypothetical protein